MITVSLLFLQLAAPQAGESLLGLQMGYRVSPDTVLVGQPFQVMVKVRAPKGVRFDFPTGPDTAVENGMRVIEPRGEKVVTMFGDTAAALYRLVAWDVGRQPLRMPDVRIHFQGQERSLPLGGANVFVRSVLPADTSLHVPRPARPLIVLPVFNWWPWIALIAAALISLLLWWVWRRYRNRAAAPVDPYVRAQEEFARIAQLRLLENGRPEEYLAAMVDVLREYLAARVHGVRRSHTTTELLRVMQPRDGVEAELPSLLTRADMVKFARARSSAEEAASGGDTSRQIVEHVEARTNPDSEPARKAAAGKAKAA